MLNKWTLALTCIACLTACGRTGLWRAETDTEIAFDTADADVLDAPDISDAPDAIDAPDINDAPDIELDVPPPVCGNRIVESGEECDDGELNDDFQADACRTNCVTASCGDGVLDNGEACDDGNTTDADICSNQCLSPALICTPCETDRECGRGIDRCVSLIDGDFCSIACDDGSECPDEFVCERRGGSRQCVPELEVCAGCFDQDGDGYGIGTDCIDFDCNDRDANINPGATEICDDIDNNCNDDAEGNGNDEVCPPDLIVLAGETVEIGGEQLYDHVWIYDGGTVVVPAFDGQPGRPQSSPQTGCLEIEARIVELFRGGAINADGAGGAGTGAGTDGGVGNGLQNSGPTGGGYGGRGGDSVDLTGGRTYGDADSDEILQGSNGGGFFINVPVGGDGEACDDLVNFDAIGGIGGGCVALRAPDVIVAGTITVSGTNGQAAVDGRVPATVDGAGGGSGGGILLVGDRVDVAGSAVLTARGGAGGRGGTYETDTDSCIGHGGGGGGGGRIKLLADDLTVRGTISVTAGRGADGPQSNSEGGANGSFWP